MEKIVLPLLSMVTEVRYLRIGSSLIGLVRCWNSSNFYYGDLLRWFTKCEPVKLIRKHFRSHSIFASRKIKPTKFLRKKKELFIVWSPNSTWEKQKYRQYKISLINLYILISIPNEIYTKRNYKFTGQSNSNLILPIIGKFILNFKQKKWECEAPA